MPHLLVARDEANAPIAFMGIDNQMLKMLFVNPLNRGQGVGKKLVQYGIKEYAVNELTVNEQNPQATGFYEHIGFRVYRKTDTDEQGKPYPPLAVNAGRNGYIYAMADDVQNKIIYVELTFHNFFTDIDYERVIPKEYLPIGFDAKTDNPYREEYRSEL